jgi:hypothetical protein
MGGRQPTRALLEQAMQFSIGDLVRHANGKEGILTNIGKTGGYAAVQLHNGPRGRVAIDKLTLVKTAAQLKAEHEAMIEKSRAESKVWAKEHFAIEIGQDRHEDDMLVVSTTHNGHQWSSLSLYREELTILRDAINEYIAKEQP